MTLQKKEVLIIGAGSAGLTARREVAKQTSSYLIFDPGPYGTTCARVGCMPSKALIQVAEHLHQTRLFQQEGLEGAEHLKVNSKQVLQHVRQLRDHFVYHTKKGMDSWREHLKPTNVRFQGPQTLEDESGQIYEANHIIIACGSRPKTSSLADPQKALTTNEFFEEKNLPQSLAVLGSGVIALEIGQACHHLGIQTDFFLLKKRLSLFTDPEIHDYALNLFENQYTFKLLNPQTSLEDYEKILVAIGRENNLMHLNLEAAGLDPKNLNFDEETLQIQGTKHFLAGDCTGDRTLLHEAADEGRIAGLNSLKDHPQAFLRRTPLGIVFSSPQIALIGKRFSQLPEGSLSGKVNYEHQGRARIKGENQGLLKIYGNGSTGELLGAEMIGPQAEHLAHFLAILIQKKMKVSEALQLPFYHPVLEEGLRTALRDLKNQIPSEKNLYEIQKKKKPKTY